MSKPTKMKKEKVPKITEAQYAEYIASLKDAPAPSAQTSEGKENGVQRIK